MAFVQAVQRFWILVALAFVAGGVALVSGAIAANITEADALAKHPLHPDVSGWKITALIAGLLVLAFALLERIFGDIVDRRLKRDIETAQAATLTVVNGALMPIAHHLVEVAAMDQTRRPQMVEGIRQAVVASAIGLLVHSDDCRVSYFPAEGERGKRVMKRHITRAGKNRTDEPTSEFKEGSSENAAVWKLIDSGEAVFWPDLGAKQPDTWAHSGTPNYRTYISVGVTVDGVGFGMLTANATKIDQLDGGDLATMRALAYLLASAEALGKGTQKLNQLRKAIQAQKSAAEVTVPETGRSA